LKPAYDPAQFVPEEEGARDLALHALRAAGIN